MQMPLHCWCYTLGLFLLISGAAALLIPAKMNTLMTKFCRSQILGILLCVVSWAWAGYALWVLPIDFLLPYQKYIPYLIAAFIPLTCIGMENLLACRALGGILVLYPYTLLQVARVHQSPWRILIVAIAYISIIKGMTLLLYPWKMRQCILWMQERPLLMRTGGVINLGLGAALLYLGITVLR
ncbi:MAG: hypothetical protein WC340_12105 [Kiritimatiellia bacterium]